MLQLLLSMWTLCGFLRLLVARSHEDRLGSGLASVTSLGSVLLRKDKGDMIVEVVLVSLQRVRDDSFPVFFSCVQATLGVVGKQREPLRIKRILFKMQIDSI